MIEEVRKGTRILSDTSFESRGKIIMRSGSLFRLMLRRHRGARFTMSLRFPNPLDVALRNVKGRNRREMIRDFHAEGNLEALCAELLSDTLDEKVRDSIGRIHPSFMGGEYLPNYTRHEVEIARIELRSTTSDVISIRARPRGKRHEYAVCDEYGSEFSLPQRTSSHPFSLRKLIWFLDNVEHCESDPGWNRFGFVLSYNQCNLDCGTPLGELENFTRITSDFYPDLTLHYAQTIAEWHQFCRSNALPRFSISQSATNPR